MGASECVVVDLCASVCVCMGTGSGVGVGLGLGMGVGIGVSVSVSVGAGIGTGAGLDVGDGSILCLGVGECLILLKSLAILIYAFVVLLPTFKSVEGVSDSWRRCMISAVAD